MIISFRSCSGKSSELFDACSDHCCGIFPLLSTYPVNCNDKTFAALVLLWWFPFPEMSRAVLFDLPPSHLSFPFCLYAVRSRSLLIYEEPHQLEESSSPISFADRNDRHADSSKYTALALEAVPGMQRDDIMEFTIANETRLEKSVLLGLQQHRWVPDGLLVKQEFGLSVWGAYRPRYCCSCLEKWLQQYFSNKAAKLSASTRNLALVGLLVMPTPLL